LKFHNVVPISGVYVDKVMNQEYFHEQKREERLA
jgi:hypothetical protein